MVKIVDAILALEEILSKGVPLKTLAILLHVVPTQNVMKTEQVKLFAVADRDIKEIRHLNKDAKQNV
jgi:hypothetical protein